MPAIKNKKGLSIKISIFETTRFELPIQSMQRPVRFIRTGHLMTVKTIAVPSLPSILTDLELA